MADGAAIAAIHVASWKATYPGMVGTQGLRALTPDDRLPMWTRILGEPESPVHVWVAEIDGAVAGFCSIGPARAVAGAGELFTIYLDPGCAGRGLGHALITRAEQGMIKRGFTRAILWVLAENTSARTFYERHGWAADGETLDDTIFDHPITEVRYTKSLIGT